MTATRPDANWPRDEQPATSVDKALALLGVFNGAECLGVSEIARRAQLNKSTAFRLMTILERNGFLEREGALYRLGEQLYSLGQRVYKRRPGVTGELVYPFLSELYERTHETVHLSNLYGTDVVFLEKLHGRRSTSVPTRVGTRMPAYCTAAGKVLLAHQPELAERVLAEPLQRRTPSTIVDPDQLMRELATIREEGIAYDRQENLPRIACVAVPIFHPWGRPPSAISISVDAHRFAPAKVTHLLRATAAAARQRLTSA